MRLRSPAGPYLVIVAVISAALSLNARALPAPPEDAAKAKAVTAELWQEPADLEQRDLFNGPGGAELTPQPVTYAFVAKKTSGTNPGYDVRDSQGRLWSVKLGEESQSEVTVSRILWAIGFHQPPAYFVERWTLSGGEAAEQPAARFRSELDGHEATDEWSWYKNPFNGTRQFGALITVNLLLNNWDFKTSNNKIYVVTKGGAKERRYVVRDLGASLGESKRPKALAVVPFIRVGQGSKNNIEDFEAQGFVKSVKGERVTFDYRGIDEPLVARVTTADLRWTGQLLSRLSEQQWLDAFRAGGYTPDVSARYVRKIKEKIAQAVGS